MIQRTTPPAIRVTGLSKAYTIQHGKESQSTLAEQALSWAKNPFRRTEKETFHALKDIDLEIQQGDIVGIIGRNGAGKSTLLKVLSRITPPTTGKVELFGRVGSLLEVGTGFHPELSGRENVYLNGAILGMTRPEIRKQFDAIVDFAGVEKFLDTPVKRYSSGMYVRLAFAVAAHLDPEILIIDEVLAVGDAEFQTKCLGKMQDIAEGGRTVLFVSHNMLAIRQLCTRGLVLERGAVICAGGVDRCLSNYLKSASSRQTYRRDSTFPSAPLSIEKITANLIGCQPRLQLEVDTVVSSMSPHKQAFIAIDLHTDLGVALMQALPSPEGFIHHEPAERIIRTTIDLPPLVPGEYRVSVWVGSHNTETLDKVREAVSFEVRESPTPGRTVPHTPDHGSLVPESKAELLPGTNPATA